MNGERLVVGLPAGSLAEPVRGGGLADLLRAAGFPTEGYEKGGPSDFPLTAFLVGWDGRPQEFGAQLALAEIDVAIAGDDWVRERVLEWRYEFSEEIRLEKVLSLNRGQVRVVVIANEDAGASCDEWLKGLLGRKPLLAMASEMPYLSLEWFQSKVAALGFEETHGQFSVQKYRTPPRVNAGIVIYETWGKTEAKVKHGAVDLGVEITQTGSAIRKYGLHIVDEVMKSETGVWANPTLRDNPGKYDLARMFLLNLYGAVFAEEKVLLTFNASKENVPKLLEYLKTNNLYGDEPTINEGVNFTEFSVQLDSADTRLPLAKARYELAKLGATHIETIPLESSIPGLDTIKF